ncbi:MAG: hypothetical protein ACREO1_02525, partial [Arenimonas sp.]
ARTLKMTNHSVLVRFPAFIYLSLDLQGFCCYCLHRIAMNVHIAQLSRQILAGDRDCAGAQF